MLKHIKSFVVGPHIYKVKHDKNLKRDGFLGTQSYPLLEVVIEASAPPTIQEEAFFHELEHAACDFVGIRADEQLTAEQFIGRSSQSLYTILKQNGWLSFDGRLSTVVSVG